jgi:hypothetical protein
MVLTEKGKNEEKIRVSRTSHPGKKNETLQEANSKKGDVKPKNQRHTIISLFSFELHSFLSTRSSFIMLSGFWFLIRSSREKTGTNETMHQTRIPS